MTVRAGPTPDGLGTGFGGARGAGAALAVCVFVAALVPRLAAGGGFVTADEVRWTCRAIHFRAALESRQWAATYQTGHPGVTAMWLAAAAPGFALREDLTAPCALSPSEIAESGPWPVRESLQQLLRGARQRTAVAHAVLLTLVFVLAVPLLGAGAAALGTLLLAFEPFLVGLSRVLHVDALAGELMLVSFLLLLGHVIRERAGRGMARTTGRPQADEAAGRGRSGAVCRLVGSGALAGLAFLTKAPALYLVPCAVAALAVATVRPGRSRAAVAHLAGQLTVWGLAAAVVAVALWPSLWVAPLATTRQVLDQALGYANVAEKTTSFFLGARVEEPCWRFYPAALLLRGTLPLVVGLLLAGGSLLAGNAARAGRRPAVAALTLYAVGFALLLTVSDKKYDRYLAPALMAGGLLAGAGWDHAARWLRRRLAGPRQLRAVALALVAGCAALSLARAHPYGLSWYSPLVGGTQGARRLTLLGWGEGLEQVADYLNALPRADQTSVVGWGAALGPLYRGHTLRDKPENRDLADYLVVYVSDVQTEKDTARLLDDPGPVFTARVLGVDYAWVVRSPGRDGPQVPPTPTSP